MSILFDGMRIRLVFFQEMAGLVEEEVLALYFGFIAGLARSVGDLAGFGDPRAGVGLFCIVGDAGRQAADGNRYDLFYKTS